MLNFNVFGCREESRKKMLAEKRKAMKNQMLKESSVEPEVQIFVPDQPGASTG